MPAEVKTAEFDEIFTYIGDKKTESISSPWSIEKPWKVAWERSQAVMQAIVDHAPKAKWYFSDAFDVYASLWYHWGRCAVSEGKSDTEGDNAELRHYLARLARSSRCFSRCPYAVCLFVYYFNQRQLKKHRFPKYTFHIIDFVHSPI